MRTKTLLTLLIMLFAYNLKAQSHISKGDYKCLLVPNSGNGLGGVSCPACAKTEKAKREAKATEDKRRAVAHAEKIKKDKIASDLAFKKQQKELAEKNKLTEVFVTMPTSNSSKNKNTPIKKTADANDGNILIPVTIYERTNTNGGYFENEKGETILSNEKWREAYDVTTISPVYDCKLNIGIVRIEKSEKFTSSYYNESNFCYNIVNYKGEYLLPENEVVYVLHIKDNWFFISNKKTENYLINLTSKEKIEIPDFGRGRQKKFCPIYSENVKMNNRHLNDIHPSYSTKVKSDLMKLKPNIINENFLKQYNFVIVHSECDYDIQYIFETADKINTGKCPTTLYCFSKAGKITKITL